MIKPGGVSPMGHFRETGFSEGRSVQSRTAIGEFNGVFDEANFVEVSKEQIPARKKPEHGARN